MNLTTRVTELLGIRHPILQAGMGRVAGGHLAAAVSNAGGLGVIGSAGLTPERLAEELDIAQRLTDRPIGVDVLFPPVTSEVAAPAESIVNLQSREAMFKMLEVRKIPVVVFGMRMSADQADRVHAWGGAVVAMIGTPRHAVSAEQLGADAVIATGIEAGGHTGTVGQMVLTPSVVSAVSCPVIAGGGVADGAGLAACLALGAEGVWIGSRFLAATESLAHQNVKEVVRGLAVDRTRISRALSGKTARLLKNDFTESNDDATLTFPEQSLEVSRLRLQEQALLQGDVQNAPVPAGQSSTLVPVGPSEAAGDIVTSIVDEAHERWAALTGDPARADSAAGAR